jgi:hypothetical protein
MKKEGRASFLKKRSKKLLSIGVGFCRRTDLMGEVFLLLFLQKKKRLLESFSP